MDVTTRGRCETGRSGTKTGHWLEISRAFDAPPALVFAAFADNRHLRRWCRPEGFSVTEMEGEFRVGGAWRSEVTGPDGRVRRMAGVYREILAGALIRWSHAWLSEEGRPGPEREIEIRFEAEETGTRLRFRMGPFATGADRDGHREGWSQGLDHLDGYLPELLATDPAPVGEPVIRVARLLAHPPARVWAAWTDPRSLAGWWGPEGFATTTETFDFREGGIWGFTMRGPDGTLYPNRIAFEAIEAPRRIAYRHQGEDAADQAIFDTQARFAPARGGTRVSLVMRFASVEVRNHVARTFGAIEGGARTLARLDAWLDSARDRTRGAGS